MKVFGVGKGRGKQAVLYDLSFPILGDFVILLPCCKEQGQKWIFSQTSTGCCCSSADTSLFGQLKFNWLCRTGLSIKPRLIYFLQNVSCALWRWCTRLLKLFPIQIYWLHPSMPRFRMQLHQNQSEQLCKHNMFLIGLEPHRNGKTARTAVTRSQV